MNPDIKYEPGLRRARKKAQLIYCNYCGEPPGSPCRTFDDNRASIPHLPRRLPFELVFEEGWKAARRSIYDSCDGCGGETERKDLCMNCGAMYDV